MPRIASPWATRSVASTPIVPSISVAIAAAVICRPRAAANAATSDADARPRRSRRRPRLLRPESAPNQTPPGRRAIQNTMATPSQANMNTARDSYSSAPRSARNQAAETPTWLGTISASRATAYRRRLRPCSASQPSAWPSAPRAFATQDQAGQYQHRPEARYRAADHRLVEAAGRCVATQQQECQSGEQCPRQRQRRAQGNYNDRAAKFRLALVRHARQESPALAREPPPCTAERREHHQQPSGSRQACVG